MKKFRFKSFDKDTYEELCSINYGDFLDNRIINLFLLEDSKTIGVLTINETINNDDDDNIPGGYPPYFDKINYKFNLKFYNLNLKSLSFSKEVQLINDLAFSNMGEDLFIKSLYLNILDKSIVIFIYFIYIDDNYFFEYDLFEIKLINYQKKNNFIVPVVSRQLEKNTQPYKYHKLREKNVILYF